MNKWIKVLITTIISILIYVGFYFFIIINATPENYLISFATFSQAIIFGVIAIPFGFISMFLFNKWINDVTKRHLLALSLAIIWGALFGWITLTGYIIGEYIADKGRSKGKRIGNIFDFKNLKLTDWFIVFIVSFFVLVIHLIVINMFTDNLERFAFSSSIFLIGPFIYLVGSFIDEQKSKKAKEGLTIFQKVILGIFIFFILLHGTLCNR